jgi:hypothetical protein
MGEVMDRSNRVFMQHGPFAEALPSLESALIEFTEFNLHLKGRSGKWRVESDGGLMPCGNTFCRRGGYEFDREIGRMIRDDVREKTVTLRCPGDEGSPKGRRAGRRCERYVEAKITLTYKATSETEPSAVS